MLKIVMLLLERRLVESMANRVGRLSSSLALLERKLADQRDLSRARSAIAILYTGSARRRGDGTIDVDSVISDVLGEP